MNEPTKPLAIVTGASSGVGLHTTNSLIGRGWHIIMACRDLPKAETAAQSLDMPQSAYEVAHLDLGSLASVRAFHAGLRASGRALDALVCNAAVYLPLLKEPARSPEGYEISVATNYFGHFLLAHLMLEDLQKAASPRLVTPDSFSDGGRYLDPTSAVARAEDMVEEGCQIVDIGGESTRPGAEPISAEEELARIAPVVSAVSERCAVAISIDTYKAAVAREAARCGAVVINEVWGLSRDPMMAEVVAETQCAVIVMHNRASVDVDLDIDAEVCRSFDAARERAVAAGVPEAHIILDPGIGFGKAFRQNIDCLKNIERFAAYGRPVLIGLSRKSMIGRILGNDIADRLVGTLALNQLAVMQGAAIIRVHDVAAHREMLDVLVAMEAKWARPASVSRIS